MLTSQNFAVSRMDLPFLRDRMTLAYSSAFCSLDLTEPTFLPIFTPLSMARVLPHPCKNKQINRLLHLQEPINKTPENINFFSQNTADVMLVTYLKMWRISVRQSRRRLKKWFCFQKKHEEKRISKSKGRLVPCTQYPCECCPLEKLFRHLSCQAVMPLGITYCESVFSQVLYWKCGSFLIGRMVRNNTHFRIDSWG